MNATIRSTISIGGIATLLAMGCLVWSGILPLKAQPQPNNPAQVVSETPVRSHDAEVPVGALFEQVHAWANKLTWGSVGVLVVMVIVSVMIVTHCRRFWQGKAAESQHRVEELERELDQIRQGAGRSRNERERMQEELQQAYINMDVRIQERTDSLARKCEALENELNSRRKAEKALTFQAKELERSKDVLELHVQNRTKEIQKLKSRYELILNSAGDGIYGLDEQGCTTFVNPAAAKLTGWEIEDIIGKSEQSIFFKGGVNGEMTVGEASGTVQEGGAQCDSEGFLGEQVFQRKDGTRFPVEYVRTAITEDGRQIGSVVMFKDITERKHSENALAQKADELARSNGELEQFAYVASHDLQEPLRKIQAFGDRLQAKCRSKDLKEGRDYLDRMLSAAARMQTLINDLLTFSRVISNTQPFESVDLNEITREVLGDLELRIEQTKARIEMAELPTLEADPMQLGQLLQNLLSNALKFSKEGEPPVVKIHARIEKIPFTGGDGGPEEELCKLYIEDNGIGFEERYLDKIFAVFQRLHGRSEFEGTGVGLAVCRRITDRHGGTIEAKSDFGKGATFIVTLPMKQNPPLEMAA